jgi:hypothetical protein
MRLRGATSIDTWVAAAFATAALSVLSSGVAESRMQRGLGGNSCGTWTEARQSDSSERPLMSNWVIGYVNGVNMRDSQQDILLTTDPNAIVAWMDNYCGAHPLDQVWTGAFHLVKELEARAIPEK